jgi:hypothetical protein
MFSLSAICFLVSLAMLIPTQILYTNNTIHHQLTNHPKWGWNPQSILWGGVGVLAWLTLISELVGWILIGEAITLFGKLQMKIICYKIVSGSAIVLVT